MTQLFVNEFKKLNKCQSCKKDAPVGYGLCVNHLKIARERFAKWAKLRREQKKCCYCHRSSYNGWLRCKTHTLINRARCKQWWIDHPGARVYIKARLEARLNSGICRCAAKNKIPEGFRRCDDCRNRHNKVFMPRYIAKQKELASKGL